MPKWPLTDDERMGLERLGEMLEQHGAARFVVAPLVRSNARDFPGPWQPTLEHLRALIERLFWHAYTPCEVIVEPTDAFSVRQDTAIELVEVGIGRARFVVDALGLDDVPGAASHEVGRALIGLAATHPFREIRELPSSMDGCYGAVIGSLGVVAANVACYVERRQVLRRGDLSNDAFGLLLAAQDRVRDVRQPEALATLRDSAADAYKEWRDLLEPHRDELRALMHIDTLDVEPLPPRA